MIPELQKELLSVTLSQSYMGEKIPQVWLNLEKQILGYVFLVTFSTVIWFDRSIERERERERERENLPHLEVLMEGDMGQY